ncbi:MAG: hypothetical protein K2M06_05775 [Muribaculaceae bacterium]|nr:hypothetical protein [Muribaculaceae bacterium]
MKLRLSILLLSIFALAASSISAAPVDDARRMIDDGRYDEAAAALRKIVKSKPRDAGANYLLGLALVRGGAEAEGLKYMSTAETRGSADAAAFLARRAFDEYMPEDAQEHLDAWEEAARKARKSLPEDFSEVSSRVVAMDNMLRRVEKIEIIDTIRVDSAAFLSAYRIAPQSGTLVPGEALGPGSDASVVFIPEQRTEMFWAAPDSAGNTSIFFSAILDDGTREHPERAKLTDGGNVSFPFLMPDGMTLYYAADEGTDGLGGYDIYMTRRSDDGSFMQSQNMGMPYNSPFNDFMLAIDETTGLGWWASDRERIPGKLTIFVFAPSETRVNYAPDAEDLPALARLSDISLTRIEGKDYKAELESRLSHIPDSPQASSSTDGLNAPAFQIDMGSRGIYTSLADFKNEDARRAMLRYLSDETNLRNDLARLQSLRDDYSRKPSKALGNQIFELESYVDKARASLRKALNTAIRLER